MSASGPFSDLMRCPLLCWYWGISGHRGLMSMGAGQTSLRPTARPVLIHRQQCHDVLPAESLGERQCVEFARGGGGRRRHFDGAAELDGERKILFAELHL